MLASGPQMNISPREMPTIATSLEILRVPLRKSLIGRGGGGILDHLNTFRQRDFKKMISKITYRCGDNGHAATADALCEVNRFTRRKENELKMLPCLPSDALPKSREMHTDCVLQQNSFI
jgi:hypothetical protein